MIEFDLEVDSTDLVRYMDEGREAIERLVDVTAAELARELARESESASARVAASWRVESAGESGQESQVVSDQFFATFLARGTRGHGPRRAPHMVFRVAGDYVFASFVEGIRADPFDDRAIKTVEGQADDIVARLMAEVQ